MDVMQRRADWGMIVPMAGAEHILLESDEHQVPRWKLREGFTRASCYPVTGGDLRWSWR
jgi:hypothetical protein